MKNINENQLFLPHFQRDFNWKPDKQKALIASFLYNIPIGSILLLRTRTDMSTKTIGYKEPNKENSSDNEKMSYLMDGQQRLTTLKGVFDDFFKENEDGMFNKLYHHLKNRWFLELRIFDEKTNSIEESNLKIILDLIKKEEISDSRSISDVIDLIKNIQIHKTKANKPYHPKILKKEPSNFRNFLETNQYLALFLLLSTTEKSTTLSNEYKKLLVEPTAKIFEEKWFKEIKKNPPHIKTFRKILNEYDMPLDLSNQDEITSTSRQWANDLYESLRYFLTERRKLLTISYEDSFSKAVEAFTAMNRGGLPLSTFDIIVAKYAALPNKPLLKERIEEKFKAICNEELQMLPQIDTDRIFDHFLKDKDSEIQKFYNLYLNMLSIFSSDQDLATDCIKEKNKLSLTKEDIDKNTDKAITSIALAFRFLSGYCGVTGVDKISYQLIILPIAKNLYGKYEKRLPLKEGDISKILYWYWSSIFGGRYREKQNSRSIEDIKVLSEFLQPDTTEQAKKKIVRDKVFKNQGYSDLPSLEQNESPSLKNPILQFIFINKILQSNLNNFLEVVKKLELNNFEESHLISIDDYKTKIHRSEKMRVEKEHYINSVLNLALLNKERNRSDRSKSWYDWNQNKLKEDNVLIPEKINTFNWDRFSKEAKNSNREDWEDLCKNFISSRFKEIKKTMEKQLKFFEENW